ncbi:hypothetical protein, partial [Limosilactobacillus fermentum]|uniref:hypothetical protein n=1 Tax=Limosilactobacillus fermentum TaxID=1613 RepID=UPI00316ACA75
NSLKSHHFLFLKVTTFKAIVRPRLCALFTPENEWAPTRLAQGHDLVAGGGKVSPVGSGQRGRNVTARWSNLLVQLDKDINQNVNRMFEKLKEAGKNGFFPGLFLYSRMLVL